MGVGENFSRTPWKAMTLQKMLGLARPAALECLTEHGYETYDDEWRRLRRMDYLSGALLRIKIQETEILHLQCITSPLHTIPALHTEFFSTTTTALDFKKFMDILIHIYYMSAKLELESFSGSDRTCQTLMNFRFLEKSYLLHVK